MSGFQNRPDINFTMVRNEMLRNDKLSLKAKGLLAMMRSFPPDWVYYQSHLVTLSTDGRDSMRAGLKELLDYGYVTRSQSRNPDGSLGEMVYRVTDAEPTVDGFSGDGAAVSGEPEATNTYYTNTDDTNENPSSTDVDDDEWEVPSLTEEEPTASPSEKAPPPVPAAPPPRAQEDSRKLQALVDVWNAHKGKLREFKSLGAKRTRNLLKLIAECEAAGADPLAVVKLAATTLADDDHYVNGGYDLENVVQSGRLAKFIDDALTAPPEAALKEGERYAWPRDPGRPWAGRYTGTFTGELLQHNGLTFAVMHVDTGQSTNAMAARVNAKHLEEA